VLFRSAKGDGKTDDTKALKEGFARTRGGIYFPPGVYLVNDTLLAASPKRQFVQGAGPGKTIIRLMDSSPGFDDPDKPKAVLANWNEAIGKGSNGQGFRNSYCNLSVEVGAGNPGAMGILYFTNNQGTIENVVIRSTDPQRKGKAGLAMAQNWPGPALIRNVRIEGFDYGVWSIIGQYSFVFEHLNLAGQRQAGIYNSRQMLAIRDLKSANSVPVVRQDSGLTVLVDGDFTGGSPDATAIENKGRLFVRNVTVKGYKQAIDSSGTAVAGPKVEEFASGEVVTLFDRPRKSLDLPVEETPTCQSSVPDDWANAEKFGARRATGGQKVEDMPDSTEGIQKAIDSGKPIVYLPHGAYKITGTVRLRGAVQRVDMMESSILTGSGEGPAFRLEDGPGKFVILERFEGSYANKRVFIEQASPRTLVLKTCIPRGEDFKCTAKGAKLFLDDVCAAPFVFDHMTVYARQLNPENKGQKIVNDGGTLWILGLKTEKAGTTLLTRGGGKSEVLGGYIYYNRGNEGAVPVVNQESSVSFVANINGAKGAMVQETRDGKTAETSKWPFLYVGGGK